MRTIDLGLDYANLQLQAIEQWQLAKRKLIEIPGASNNPEYKVFYFLGGKNYSLRKGIEYCVFKGNECIAEFDFHQGQAKNWLRGTKLATSSIIDRIVCSHSMVRDDHRFLGYSSFFHRLMLDNNYILLVNEETIANTALWISLKESGYVAVLYCTVTQHFYNFNTDPHSLPWRVQTLKVMCNVEMFNKLWQEAGKHGLS